MKGRTRCSWRKKKRKGRNGQAIGDGGTGKKSPAGKCGACDVYIRKGRKRGRSGKNGGRSPLISSAKRKRRRFRLRRRCYQKGGGKECLRRKKRTQFEGKKRASIPPRSPVPGKIRGSWKCSRAKKKGHERSRFRGIDGAGGRRAGEKRHLIPSEPVRERRSWRCPTVGLEKGSLCKCLPDCV